MNEPWEYADTETAPVQGFPWPPPEEGPILTAFGATWKNATFDPASFFAELPRTTGTAAAVVYYLAVGILVAGATLFWDVSLFTEPGSADPLAQLGIEAVNPMVRFFLAPAVLLLTLFVTAGLVHVLLLIFDGAHHGFGTTVRVFCYAYSPALFGVVPALGVIVGSLWSVVLAIVGLREAHEADAWKPAVAVLLPFVGAVILFALFFFLMVMAAGTALPTG